MRERGKFFHSYHWNRRHRLQCVCSLLPEQKLDEVGHEVSRVTLCFLYPCLEDPINYATTVEERRLCHSNSNSNLSSPVRSESQAVLALCCFDEENSPSMTGDLCLLLGLQVRKEQIGAGQKVLPLKLRNKRIHKVNKHKQTTTYRTRINHRKQMTTVWDGRKRMGSKIRE